VDPLEWQISQEMANSIVASLANTIGAAESVLRVAATGHDKKLFFKVRLKHIPNFEYEVLKFFKFLMLLILFFMA
jgi:hypothetical protein